MNPLTLLQERHNLKTIASFQTLNFVEIARKVITEKCPLPKIGVFTPYKQFARMMYLCTYDVIQHGANVGV